ncbi:nucleolar protein 56 [Drosophila guanche]|uniref:Nucleolar protein 56 n=1 Tax=Drosophila guanche TaxID=7266 RepID=A0A3B0KNH0_DROGU|nr:nucleolar protein 56 [Drosophila guanche]SPP88139.1 blast:Nucleolar protein 56 [Drosophila guanche]
MSILYCLYEHAAGFSVFSVKEFEEVSMFLPQVESSVTDFAKFNSIVKLAGFAPFKTAIAALENINAISEGIVPQDLLHFLDDFFAKLKKKKCTLGIADAKLGAAITEAIGVQCSQVGVVPEILRGVRFHFAKLVKGFTDQSAGVAQLGLGHSYSRAKVKFNVHRSDNMIIQSIALLDQLDKDVNTFSMRIREWYSYHFPELVKIVPDNYMFAKAAKFIKDRKNLSQDLLEDLEKIVMDSAKAQAIIDAAKMSMGMDISIVDLMNIELFAERVVKLSEYRKKLSTYLHNKMNLVAPNLQSLIGDQVGARLISHAGSLTNLAKYPASTVQILGAEKALFRALKTRSNTPKYGLIYHSSFIGRAGLKNKGRISRFLANKCSIASRIDCFLDQPTSVFGESLKQQVEDRLKFYESGDVPRKNIEVMKEAIEAAGQEAGANGTAAPQSEKKKNKKKKRAAGEDETEANGSSNGNGAAADNGNGDDDGEPKKKKKKKNKNKEAVEA